MTGRFGYSISPLLYAYAESAGNFRDFSEATFNSQGYRVVGGVGTDRIGLFRGEVYAGYQKQFYDSPLFPSPSSPVLGGKVFWYPTRAWTVSAMVDETYQDAAVALVGNSSGSAAKVVSSAVNVGYVISRVWSVSASGGYSDVAYISGGRHDARWNAASTLQYEIMRNFAATFEYSLVSVASNAVGGSFTRNAFTLGGAYKY